MKSKIVLFSVIICLSIIVANAQPPKLCNVQGILVQRIEPETPLQISQETIDKLGYNPNYFKPMVGITIEAKRHDNGTVAQTKTDKNGNYFFRNLADGIYVISPLLPEEYEKAKYYATVANKDCVESKDIFEIHTVGNLKGRIENFPSGGGKALIALSFINSAANDRNNKNRPSWRDLLNSRNCKHSGKSGVIEFDCSGLPTGKYYLKVAWRDSPRVIVYHPGVKEGGRYKPEVIEIKPGQTTDASFKIPGN